MKKILFFVCAVLLVSAIASADLPTYSQDFEGMDQAEWGALANDGWVVYGNVFGYDWWWWYGYGTFPAPNGGSGFCAVAAGEGGLPQGDQQLVVYNDYNNWEMQPIAWVEALVFKEFTIGAADLDFVYTFSADVKRGDLLPPSTAKMFIKTLNPAWGWATTNFISVDTHTMPTTWSTASLSIAINDPELVGQLLQIGFLSTTTNYTPSGMLYDNINFEGIRVVDIDIKPGSDPNPLRVNFRGRGVFTVAILGEDGGFDASTVDVGTVTLAGVPALRGKVGDVNQDGNPDMVLKFNRQAILDALVALVGPLEAIPNREELFLTLLGSTTGGDAITGTDSLRILNRGAIKRRR